MADAESDKLRIFGQYYLRLEATLANLGEVCSSDDNDVRNFIRGFIKETYKNFMGAIKEIEQAFHSNSFDYNTLTNRVESIKNLMEKYRSIFIAVGIAEEEIKDKEAMLSQFLTH